MSVSALPGGKRNQQNITFIQCSMIAQLTQRVKTHFVYISDTWVQ